jgi:hypothetical protein
MPRTKANQPKSSRSSVPTHTPAKGLTKARQSTQQTPSYQPYYVWVSFLWSLMTLGIMSQRLGVQAQGLPATLDLASLMATQGMVIQGAVAGDRAGYWVSSAGDVNGDGLNDLLVGAWEASSLSRSFAGAAYLIYGSRTLSAVLDLNTLTASQGMVIQGAVAGDALGISVSSAGDVNGDGINDLVVGAWHASPVSRSYAGEAYLIYGSRALLPAVLDLNALTAAQGMVIQGAASGEYAGISVASSGDVNGDGLSDLVVGANNASPVSRSLAGAAYVIYGSRTLSAVLDLNTLTPTQGMVIQGAAANDFAGSSVSGAGDVNGDGISDLMVGAYQASPLTRSYAGAAYLIYGSRVLPAVLDLATPLTAAQGMVIQGAVANDFAGSSVSGAGDVNDDGISDLVVGAYQASPLTRRYAGAAYLIYGSRTFPAVLDLNTTLTATQGMVIQGAVGGEHTGISVASAGDVNGDNITDLLVGAANASPLSRRSAGEAYLIYGSRVWPAVLDLNTLTPTQGTVIHGAVAGDTVGYPVSSAGDINGDGIADLLVGAYFASPVNRAQAGAAYLIYGKSAITPTSLMRMPSTKTTAGTTVSINTLPSTISLGIMPSSAITTTTMATGVTIATATTASTVSMTVSSLTGATTMAARQTLPPLPSDSRVTSANSGSSESLAGSGESTTRLIETPTQTMAAGGNSGISGTVIGAAAGSVGGGLALAACLAGVGFYACRKKSRSTKSNEAAKQAPGVALKDKQVKSSEYGPINLKGDIEADNVVSSALPISMYQRAPLKSARESAYGETSLGAQDDKVEEKSPYDSVMSALK